MIDIKDVEIVEAPNGEAKAVVPASETKQVFIPSPPTMNTVAINPRPCVIYVADAEITDEMKAYCKENKVVFVLPKKDDAEKMMEAYNWAIAKATVINIKKDEVSVKADEANKELAEELVEAISDELDVELGEVEVFSI